MVLVIKTPTSSQIRFSHRTTWQPSKQELISQLTIIMFDLIREFKEKNGTLPKRIFVFRDGVGDGQLAAVREIELANIKEAIAMVSAANDGHR